MGLLGTMSAIGTALGPSLGGVLIAGLGWRAIFLVNVPLGMLALRARATATCRPIARRRRPSRAGFDMRRHAAARADARRLCARHDDRARQLRPAQRGAAAGRRVGVGLFVLAEARAPSPLIRAGDVPRPRAERGPRDERAGLDGDDGDAGGRAVLPVARARARRGRGRPRHVRRPARRRADRRAGRSPGRPLRRAAHDPRRAGRAWRPARSLLAMAAGAARRRRLRRADRRRHRRLRAVPGRQQHAVMADISSDQRGAVSGMLNLSRNLGLITGASAMGAVFAHAAGATNISAANRTAVAAGMHATFAVAALLIAIALVIALGSRALTARLLPVRAAE